MPVALSPAVRNANAQLLSQFFAQSGGASPAVLEYRRKLQEYQAVRGAFDEEAGAYWSQISEKRKGRNAKRRERVAILILTALILIGGMITGLKGFEGMIQLSPGEKAGAYFDRKVPGKRVPLGFEIGCVGAR